MGHRGPLQLSNLCKLYNEESVHTLCSVFEREWEKQQNYNERSDLEKDCGRESLLVSSKNNTGYSLLYAIWVTFRPALVKLVLLRLSTDVFSILGPLTLRWVILFCERQAVFDWAQYTYSLVVLGAVCCCAVSQHHFEKHSRIIMANAQAVLAGCLYRKALKFLTWESWFHQRVTESRARELEMLRILGYLTAFSMLNSICMPFLVGFSSLGVFVLADDGNVLTPSQIFTSLCFFRFLRPTLLELPGLLCVLKQAQKSLCHLEKIFLTKDLGTSQLVTTKEELPTDGFQQPCDGYKDKHINSDEKSDQYLSQKGSGEARRLYLRAFGRPWMSVSLLLHLSVCAVSLAQDGILSMWTGEAKEVQGLDGWRELRNSRLSAYALLGLLQGLLINYTLSFCQMFFTCLCISRRQKQEDCCKHSLSWAVLRLDGIAGIVLFLVSLILLETKPDSGLVVLALICAFNIKEALHCYPQAVSDINVDMLSVQNLCEFAKVEKEIGVVSREKTDADGLVSCLYRSVEARGGAVLIDNVNIAHVGLHDLRSSLQIISQVPVLFSGPLRANLDPFAQHTDAQVWLALELCHLKEHVRLLPAQLLRPVQRTSLAFSFGQRRLLCLARALLARVKVLLVEDALPSVDLETEDLVRQVIRTEFKDCTVLWLTQNPFTVMHTDRLLVLNKGQAVNFDAPATLLQQGPLFSQ
ncbi:multidrug resistance-associated 1-like protein [Labeo rohita]|uniref:Multidrug resistance-associated 1-like protein n=1 Tax=Labeo rohita TaxID=84645 RepID=A0A498N0T9_LABRO|nr:multidrug resistance-associated 1-like protein [Labeo rohita]